MASRFLGFSLVLFSSLLITCDPFQEDLIQKDNQVVFNPNNQTVHYILPNSCAVIDLNSIVKSTFVNLKLDITIDPERGELLKLSDFILKYEPRLDFTEGYDRFTYSVNATNGRMMKTDTIYIVMRQDVGEFPCRLFAVEDFTSIQPGSGVSISFLDNDRICDVEKKDLFKSIYSEPQHGIATLTDDKISYTANAGYNGWDQFAYRISTAEDNRGTTDDSVTFSLGLISILVDEEPCGFTPQDDDYSYKVGTSTLPWFELPVLDNDVVCLIDSVHLGVLITQGPKFGAAWPIEGRRIRYQKSSTFTESYEDSFSYGLYYRGSFSQAVVRISVTVDHCVFFNVNDYELDLTDDTFDPQGMGDCAGMGYDLPVYDINSICRTTFSEFRVDNIEEPKHGSWCLGSSGELAYLPDPNDISNDTLKLEFCYTKDIRDREGTTSCQIQNIYIRREAFKIVEHSTDLFMHLASTLENCVARIGYSLRKETSPGNYEQALAAQGPGCTLHADEYRFSSLADGRYAFFYDIIWESIQPQQGSDFTITWTSSKGTSIFEGHDTEDLLGGPKLVQYFEKRGASIFIRSDIKTLWPKPIDVDVNLTWDAGDGTAGDVDLDLYTYQFKPSAAWDIGGAVGMYLLAAKESPGATFETISTILGSDDMYFFVVDYISGTSDNVSFTLTISTDSGTINLTEKGFSLSGNYKQENLGRSDCLDPFAGPCNSVVSFRKNKTNIQQE